MEWIRCFSKHAIADEDTWLMEHVLLQDGLYRRSQDDPMLVININARRPLAEASYYDGLGRLGRIKFLRPSEHGNGKHYSLSGPKVSKAPPSYFYRDVKSEVLATLFWQWFDDIFLLIEASDGRRMFAREVETLWEKFRSDNNVRIAIDAVLVVGEHNGITLTHLAIDLDLSSGVAHAYPITHAEALKIASGVDLRPIKPSATLAP